MSHEGTKQLQLWCAFNLDSALLTSWYTLNIVQYSSLATAKKKKESISQSPIGGYRDTTKGLAGGFCNVVGSVKSFGGQVKVESMMCTNIHMHTYTHAYTPRCPRVRGACSTVQTADPTSILSHSETKPCPWGQIRWVTGEAAWYHWENWMQMLKNYVQVISYRIWFIH